MAAKKKKSANDRLLNLLEAHRVIDGWEATIRRCRALAAFVERNSGDLEAARMLARFHDAIANGQGALRDFTEGEWLRGLTLERVERLHPFVQTLFPPTGFEASKALGWNLADLEAAVRWEHQRCDERTFHEVISEDVTNARGRLDRKSKHIAITIVATASGLKGVKGIERRLENAPQCSAFFAEWAEHDQFGVSKDNFRIYRNRILFNDDEEIGFEEAIRRDNAKLSVRK